MAVAMIFFSILDDYGEKFNVFFTIKQFRTGIATHQEEKERQNSKFTKQLREQKNLERAYRNTKYQNRGRVESDCNKRRIIFASN